MNKGDQAYEIVRVFSEMGIHRTGTQGDFDTSYWLGSELAVGGADVSFQTFPYHHFDAEVSVQCAGKSIEAEALYYSFVGQRNLSNLATGLINAHANECVISHEIDCKVDGAKVGGFDGLVLATQCPTGDLCAINRDNKRYLDFPVIIISQDNLNKIQTSGAEIFFAASSRKLKARNVIARFPGPTCAPRVVVTTPISGWFRCAGERGCGLAIAIFVSKQLSKSFAVDLLLTSGHELGMCGGYHLAQNYKEKFRCVLHLGSCIANIDTKMTSICSADTVTARRIASTFKRLGIKLITPSDPSNAKNWVGESMCWASNDWPILSVTGLAPHFHTRSDLLKVVTTPGLLATAIDIIRDSALALANHGKN